MPSERPGSKPSLLAALTLIFLVSFASIASIDAKRFYGWGRNDFNGALATGDFVDRNIPTLATTINVTSLEGSDIKLWSAGVATLVYTNENGAGFCVGYNNFGQCGVGYVSTKESSPLKMNLNMLPVDDPIKDIVTGYTETAILTAGGLVFTAGQAFYRGAPTQSSVFTKINELGALNNESVTDICVGFYWMMAKTATNRLVAWGNNFQGQLSYPPTAFDPSPGPVEVNQTGVLLGRTITAIRCGSSFAVVQDSTGALFAWGGNTAGQIGDGTFIGGSPPDDTHWWPSAVIMTPFVGKSVVNFQPGHSQVLAVTNDGSLFAWGSNIRGEIGDGTSVNKNVPTLIAAARFGGRTVRSVAGAWYWSLAVDDLGRIWTWGTNSRFELGAGSVGPNSTIPILANMTNIPGGTIRTAKAFGSFGIAIDDSALPPIAAPVAPPVNPPVAAPINPPVAPPINPPAAPPINPPAAPPIDPPVAPPLRSPVAPPVAPPAQIPIAAPETPPQSPPTSSQTPSGIIDPESPVFPPGAGPSAEPIEPPSVAPSAPPTQIVVVRPCFGSQPVPGAFCDETRGVWVVPQTVIVPPDSALNVTNRIEIQGNLTLSATSRIQVTLNPTLQGSPITIDGCAQFSGTLEVSLGGITLSNSNSFTIATYSTLCDPTGTKFSSIRLLNPPPTKPCEKLNPTVQYGTNALVLLISIDSSECATPSDSAITGSALQPVAVALIVVAVVVVVAAVVGVAIWRVLRAKNAKQRLIRAQEMANKEKT